MKAQRDPITKKWFVQFRYTSWTGERKKTTKRGFDTKKEAENYVRTFLQSQKADLNMKLEDYVQLYYSDIRTRVRQHTMKTKKYVIDLKIVPTLGLLKMNEIKPINIRNWQNNLIKQGYSQTYLRTIQNQLNAIFHHACKFHDLKENPCEKAGGMGKNKAPEMLYWTQAEFMSFIDSIMDKRISYIAFMVLYYSGIRIGELMALTKADFNFEKRTITISKSYQRLDGCDVITEPKTEKSIRTISMPKFLVIDLQDYINSLYEIDDNDRIFPVTKSYFNSEMKRGIKLSGVKKIRVHDLRHSHVAHLIHLNFSLLEIAERLGHSRIETTMVYAHLYPNKQQKLANKLDEEYREGLV